MTLVADSSGLHTSMATTVDSKVLEEVDSSLSQHEKLQLLCLEVKEQIRDSETSTVDSGITETSDHASSDRASSVPDSPNQLYTSTGSRCGSMDGELDVLHTPHTSNIATTNSDQPVTVTEQRNETGSTASVSESHKEESSLLECLEPRPASSCCEEKAGEGGVSPKDVHRHLMRKIGTMSSNGHNVSHHEDNLVVKVTERRDVSPQASSSLSTQPTTASSNSGQQKSWTIKLPFQRK